ncbi:cryptochrome-1 [Arapaima gigas]
MGSPRDRRLANQEPYLQWKILRLTFEYDSEPFGEERDAAVRKLAKEAGVNVIVKTSHTLYDLDKQNHRTKWGASPHSPTSASKC